VQPSTQMAIRGYVRRYALMGSKSNVTWKTLFRVEAATQSPTVLL
jgi:hypothetical protein